MICADLLEILDSAAVGAEGKKPKKDKTGKKKHGGKKDKGGGGGGFDPNLSAATPARSATAPPTTTTTTTATATTAATAAAPPNLEAQHQGGGVLHASADDEGARESGIGKIQYIKMCYRAKFKVTTVPVAERITPCQDPHEAHHTGTPSAAQPAATTPATTATTASTASTGAASTADAHNDAQMEMDALAETTASLGGWSHLESYTTVYIGAPVYANHLPAPCRSWLVGHRDKLLTNAAKKVFHFFTTTRTSGATELFADISEILGISPVSTLCVLSKNAETWKPKKIDFFRQDPGAGPTNYLSEGRIEELYEILPTVLGKGTFSVVYKGVHKATGEFVAVKKLQKNSLRPETMRLLRREMVILRKLTHPNIVHLRDVFETEESVFMIIELVTGGELWQSIVSRGSLSEEEARHVLRQVLEAVDYMHSNGIIHRDLKPENLLCVDSTGLNVKITDFGLATDSVMEPSVVTPCGTPSYVAPEVFQGGEYDNKCDVWSTGVLLYVMLSGYMPFDADSLDETLRRILSGKLYFPANLFGNVSAGAKSLIQMMLTVSPDQRPTAADCLAHPWLSQVASTEPLYTKAAFMDKQNSFYKYLMLEGSMEKVD
ncbi:myosin light chain kinase [Pelomyxa schiedti]|nr:myosin light chain kinase [Pelomyxa schiedti]